MVILVNQELPTYVIHCYVFIYLFVPAQNDL